MLKLKRLKNNSGAMVLVLLIAIVSVILITAAMFAMWSNGYYAPADTRVSEDGQSLTTAVRMILGNSSVCPTQYQSLNSLNGLNGSNSPLIFNEFYHFQVKRVQTTTITSVPTSVAAATARLSVINFVAADDRGATVNVGAPVPIYLVYDSSGNLSSCRATAFVNNTTMETVEMQDCSAMSSTSQYDPGLDACT